MWCKFFANLNTFKRYNILKTYFVIHISKKLITNFYKIKVRIKLIINKNLLNLVVFIFNQKFFNYVKYLITLSMLGLRRLLPQNHQLSN